MTGNSRVYHAEKFVDNPNSSVCKQIHFVFNDQLRNVCCAGLSCCVADSLVDFDCYLVFDRIFVSLSYSLFTLSILIIRWHGKAVYITPYCLLHNPSISFYSQVNWKWKASWKVAEYHFPLYLFICRIKIIKTTEPWKNVCESWRLLKRLNLLHVYALALNPKSGLLCSIVFCHASFSFLVFW